MVDEMVRTLAALALLLVACTTTIVEPPPLVECHTWLVDIRTTLNGPDTVFIIHHITDTVQVDETCPGGDS
jgi:hypothetical protein